MGVGCLISIYSYSPSNTVTTTVALLRIRGNPCGTSVSGATPPPLMVVLRWCCILGGGVASWGEIARVDATLRVVATPSQRFRNTTHPGAVCGHLDASPWIISNRSVSVAEARLLPALVHTVGVARRCPLPSCPRTETNPAASSADRMPLLPILA